MINECSIFDKVDMTGFLYNLQPEVTHDKDGKIHQRSNRKYENKNNTCYVSKKKKKIKSKIKNQNTEIHGRACFNAKENHNCVQNWKFQDICKWWWIRLNSVVSIDLKTMAQTYLCSVCHSPLNIDNTVAWCEKLSNASSQSQIQMQR